VARSRLTRIDRTRVARPGPPAKLSPPRPAAAVPRHRLFRALDRARRRPLVWVTGPPGAGKTTLVASYLAARRVVPIWYRVDTEDADVGGLFYYLGRAVRRLAPRQRPLPLLNPEYRPGLPAFTRRFFETFFARLRQPGVVVFDNFQAVTDSAAFHAVMRDALGQVPDGVCIIVISRDEPPAALAALRAGSAMTVIDADLLRLTLREATAIARARRPRLPRAVAQQVAAAADGWPAGLVLLLEQPGPHLRAAARQTDVHGLFDFFAAEVFEQLDPDAQAVLLTTSFLPQVTGALAVRLSGQPRAAAILAALARRGYFTVACEGPERTYEYHPLFRVFLRARADRALSGTARSHLLRAAADALLATEHAEDAAELLIEATDWAALASLVRAVAPPMLGQGRGQTLERWLRALPASLLEEDGWLLAHLGACRLPVSPPESQRHFERAFHRLRDAGDRVGAMLAWSGLVQAMLVDWGDLASLDPWIEALEPLVGRPPAFPSPEIEAAVTLSMIHALIWRQPHHPDIGAWVARGLAIGRTAADPTARALALSNCAFHPLTTGDLPAAAPIIDLLRAAARAPDVGPVARLWARVIEANHAWLTGANAECVALVAEGLRESREAGLRFLEPGLVAQSIYATLSDGDVDGAREHLRQLGAALQGLRPSLHHDHYHYLAGWAAMLGRDVAAARSHLDLALAGGAAHGAVFPTGVNHLAMAQVRHAEGDGAAARTHLEEARAIGERIDSHGLVAMSALIEADLALDAGDREAARAALRTGLPLARRLGLVNYGWWRPGVMARLCAAALEAGIEEDFVRSLVRTRRLVPDPATALERWPWAVKVFTLGGFRIERDGQPLTVSRKTQRRPLELLQALVALGGRDVATARLADALWPGADGDAAHHALESALYRLRRLVGSEAAVTLRGGKVSVEPREVWVDALALEVHLRAVEAAVARAEHPADALAPAVALLEAYVGPFLEGVDAAWAVAARARLDDRIVRGVLAVGRALEASERWRDAMDLYERGAAVAPSLSAPLGAAAVTLRGRRPLAG
jgi:LuxR family maltose regulon positive regulatory protein